MAKKYPNFRWISGAWPASVLLALALMLLTALPALAQDTDDHGVEQRGAALAAAAERVVEASEAELIELREAVRATRQEAELAVAPLRTRADELSDDLARLGELPDEGATELPEITLRRRELQDEFDRLDADIRQSELNTAEATRLLVDIATRRRDAFYERVFERDSPPFTRDALEAIFAGMQNDRDTVVGRYSEWKTSFETPADFRTSLFALFIGVLIAIVLLFPVPRLIDRSLFHQFDGYDPTPARKATLAALRVLTRALPALVAATIIYQLAAANGIVTENTSRLAGSILLALGTIFVVEDVATAVFAPKRPQWRLIPLVSERAPGVRFLLVLIVVVFSTSAVLIRWTEWLGSVRELVTPLTALVTLIGGVLVVLFTRRRLWVMSEQHLASLSPESLNFWRWVRTLAGVLAVLSILAVIVGYVALGRFVLMRLYFLSFLFVAAWFLRALLSELADRIGAQISRSMHGGATPKTGEPSDDQRLLVFWLRLLIDLAVFASVLPITLLVLGVQWADMRSWVFDAFFGFKIGDFTISLANIFSAFAAVVVILLATRFLQRTVDTRIFGPARMESGLRNTFRTLIGYVGLVIGFMVGIGTLGFPLANLAIVAGALSLGIGFGLQSIVNNFVSGLILLFERPIKVGDWIITSAGEGIVKRISVRSTEIETFDWASVIIPNSELITAPVTNWTHKNRYTRIIINIGVSYSSDPEFVAELLQKEAKANRRTLSYPAPVIYFSGYGDSSLDFEVRVFINNVDDRIPVRNEIRYAIFKTFKEHNIEIPFPQRDLHVRSIQPGTILAGSKEPDPSEMDDVQPSEEGDVAGEDDT